MSALEHFPPLFYALLLCQLNTCVVCQLSKTFRVTEKSPEGTVVVSDLSQVLGIADLGHGLMSPKSDLDKRGNLLAISNAALPGASCFKIDELRGSLVVRTPPDRDKLCPTPARSSLEFATVGNGIHDYKSEAKKPLIMPRQDLFRPCAIQLSIVYGSSSDPSFDMLTIIIEDLNDHAPAFNAVEGGRNVDGEYIIRILETARYAPTSTELGQHPISVGDKIPSYGREHKLKISLPEATDADAPEYGIRHYRLEGDDAYLFHLEIGPIDENVAVEVNPRPLGLQPSSEKRLWLVPTKTSGYGRSGGDTSNSGDSSGGLDYEQRKEYRFVLVAVDGGVPPRSGRLQVRLIVEDVNDNAPVFHQSHYIGVMSEDDPPGQTILQFQASDADGKYENHRINFRIPGSTLGRNGSFPSQSAVASGSTISSLPLSEAQAAAAALFDIELVNVYDMEGKISESTYNQHMYRNSTAAKLIVQRKSEKELRQAAKRALEVANKFPYLNLDLFQGGPGIDKSSLLRENAFTDRSNVLRFLIEAYDFGKPALSTQVPVYVELIDVNDNAPSIFVDYLSIGKHYRTKNQTEPKCGILLEGQGRSLIAQVTVTDSDSSSTKNEVACSLNDSRFSLEPIPSLASQSAPRNWHEDISQLTPGWGLNSIQPVPSSYEEPLMLMYKLMSKGPLDREATSSDVVHFLITCTDNQNIQMPSKQLTSHANVCIEIEDVNDNPPQFTSNLYTFRMTENVPSPSLGGSTGPVRNRFHNLRHGHGPGHFVGKVYATDKDTGLNAAVEYSLSSNANGVVDIDPVNGSLYLLTPFDREKTQQFVFAVIATDRRPASGTDVKQEEGGKAERLSSTAEVRIIIDDVNDCPPEFDSSSYNFEVEENVELAEVGRVTATDADTGDFGRVRYRIAHDPGPSFTSSSLNRNDSASNSSTARQHLLRQNSQLAITSQFQIDSRLGIIRLRGRLDREKKTHYEFLVLAVDNVPSAIEVGQGGQRGLLVSFTATATVLVMVMDQNDNAPQIISPRNLAEFMLSPEQMIAGTTIFTIQATDSDLGENATVEFELMETGLPFRVPAESGGENLPSQLRSLNASDGKGGVGKDGTTASTNALSQFPFAIDRTIGICYLKQNLPPITNGGANSYTFRIKAYDLGSPVSLNSTITVRITRGSPGKITSGSEAYAPSSYLDVKGGRFPANYVGSYRELEDAGSVGEYGLSDKSMIIVLTTVFALLLLFAVLLLIFFRHRRSLHNRSLVNGVLGKAVDDKTTDGYVAGSKCSRPDNSKDVLNQKPTFHEVVPAPWVNSPGSLHSPMRFTYSGCISPTMSPRLASPQLCYRNDNLAHAQSLKSPVLQGSPVTCNITPTARQPRISQPALTPSAFVFRNYRTNDTDGYQVMNDDTKIPGMEHHLRASQAVAFTTSAAGFVPTTVISSTPKGGCVIRLNEIAPDKSAKYHEGMGNCDPLGTDAGTENYQRTANGLAIFSPTSPVNYATQHLTETGHSRKKPFRIGGVDVEPMTFENRELCQLNDGEHEGRSENNRKNSSTRPQGKGSVHVEPMVGQPRRTQASPKRSTPGANPKIRPVFVTPPRIRHVQAASTRNLSRSLSTDSSLNNARFGTLEQSENGHLYNPIQISPFASPKHLRVLYGPEASSTATGVNFITKAKTLGPEVRGSFV
ncbi:Origin recognition complex subunit 2 [Sparganum proliferum]